MLLFLLLLLLFTNRNIFLLSSLLTLCLLHISSLCWLYRFLNSACRLSATLTWCYAPPTELISSLTICPKCSYAMSSKLIGSVSPSLLIISLYLRLICVSISSSSNTISFPTLVLKHLNYFYTASNKLSISPCILSFITFR